MSRRMVPRLVKQRGQPRPLRVVLHGDPTNQNTARLEGLVSRELEKNRTLLQKNALYSAAPELRVGLRPSDFSDEFLENAEVLVTSMHVGGPELALLKDMFPTLPCLRWIHALTTGVDAILPSYLAIFADEDEDGKRVAFTNARNAFSYSLAEYALAGMLHFNKQVPRFQTHKAQHKWEKFEMSTMRGKRVGFIGFGDIAQATARMLLPMNLGEIVVHRRQKNLEEEWRSLGSKVRVETDKVAVFRECDFVICTLPGTAATAKYCDEACFQSAKEGSVFVSLGRGSAVDEDALTRHAYRFAGLVLDVFAKEPLPQESPLWTLDNILISSHTADLTDSYELDTVSVFGGRLRQFLSADFTAFDDCVDIKSGY